MTRRVIQIETSIEVEDAISVDAESIRVAIALAAAQATRKYTVARVARAHVVLHQGKPWADQVAASAAAAATRN